MADPNALVFMCARHVFAPQSRASLHMKRRTCVATRAFPRLQAGAGAIGAVSAPARALAYPHCARNRSFAGKLSYYKCLMIETMVR